MTWGTVHHHLFWSDFEQQLGALRMTRARSNTFSDLHAHTH